MNDLDEIKISLNQETDSILPNQITKMDNTKNGKKVKKIIKKSTNKKEETKNKNDLNNKEESKKQETKSKTKIVKSKIDLDKDTWSVIDHILSKIMEGIW